jgi:hypothetical protein
MYLLLLSGRSPVQESGRRTRKKYSVSVVILLLISRENPSPENWRWV